MEVDLTAEFVIYIELIAIPILFVFGAILHFIYGWTGESNFFARFGAVNESTWEHIKIGFWPLFALMLIEVLILGPTEVLDLIPTFYIAKAVSMWGFALILPVSVWSYKLFTKKNVLMLDIPIFLLSIAFVQYMSVMIMMVGVGAVTTSVEVVNALALFSVLILGLMFVFFTYSPPRKDLWKCPRTGRYGV